MSPPLTSLPPPTLSHPSRLLQSPNLSSLSYTANFRCLSILHTVYEEDWEQKDKRVSEDEMTGWNHQCNEHEFGWTSGDGEGQRGLACCSPWGHKKSDTTGWLNDNKVYMERVTWSIYTASSFQNTYRHPSVSTKHWFQKPVRISKSVDAQVSYFCCLVTKSYTTLLQPHGL